MINKKLLVIGTAITACFTLNTFATELSPAIIQTCTNYINNPTKQAGEENAAALELCQQNEDQLADVANSGHQLDQWQYNRINTPPTKATAPVAQPAPGTAIPQEFHATNPSQPVQTPTYAAPATAAPTQATQPAQQAAPAATTPQTAQPANEKKPSINWF